MDKKEMRDVEVVDMACAIIRVEGVTKSTPFIKVRSYAHQWLKRWLGGVCYTYENIVKVSKEVNYQVNRFWYTRPCGLAPALDTPGSMILDRIVKIVWGFHQTIAKVGG